MSKTMVLAPIMKALVKAEDILGKNRQWNAINENQGLLLDGFFPEKDELRGFSEKELRSWVNWKAAKLNEILRKEGFDIQLNDFRPNEFGVVSILDVLVEWLLKGEKTEIRVGNIAYPAVKIEPMAKINGKVESLFQVYSSPKNEHSVAMLCTKSGDKLHMTIADRAYEDFSLISRIDEIRSTLRQHKSYYDYLLFPMVDLNQQVDIGWLKGVWTIMEDSGNKSVISQALQQTKFKMDETGARVKSAVAVGILTLGAHIDHPLIIDKPFFLWIERPGMTIPIMYAYIDKENWKNPGNLDL